MTTKIALVLHLTAMAHALAESHAAAHVAHEGGAHDPCWHTAKNMLSSAGLQAVEEEARHWRRSLSQNLEKYYNEQQVAYYARHPRAKQAVEQRWKTDFHPRPPNTGNSLRDLDELSTNSQEAYTRRRFDFFLPRGVAERTRHLCKRPLLLGDAEAYRGNIDGFMACGVDEMVATRRGGGGIGGASDGGGGCVVYSLGSNNQFSFEEAVLQKTNCSVHTFDCTSRPPKRSLGPRFTFYPTCVGQSKKGMDHPELFKPLPTIMRELGHEKLSIVKWDVEGFEYDIFRDVLSEGSGLHSKLPREMLFELHYRSHMGARTAWWDREKTAGEVAMLAVDLYDAGYRVIGAHINAGCSSCYEYTLLRVTCPERTHAQ